MAVVNVDVCAVGQEDVTSVFATLGAQQANPVTTYFPLVIFPSASDSVNPPIP